MTQELPSQPNGMKTLQVLHLQRKLKQKLSSYCYNV